MKKFILLILCLLFAYFTPITEIGQPRYAFSTAEQSSDIPTVADPRTYLNEITAPPQVDSPYSAIIAHFCYSFSSQQRHHSIRQQFRALTSIHVLQLWFKILSRQLTTLIRHISQVYTTIKIPCWQRAVDGYLFVNRHIII